MDPESLITADLPLPLVQEEDGLEHESDEELFDADVELQAETLLHGFAPSTLLSHDTEDSASNVCTTTLQCSCSMNCSSRIPDAHRWALKFPALSQDERVGFVRAMCFATTARPGTENMLLPRSRTMNEKAKNSATKSYSSTRYAFLSEPVCLPFFSSVVHLSARTIQRHANAMSSGDGSFVYASKYSKNERPRGVQRMLVYAFLMHVASREGIECPRGRVSLKECPIP